MPLFYYIIKWNMCITFHGILKSFLVWVLVHVFVEVEDSGTWSHVDPENSHFHFTEEMDELRGLSNSVSWNWNFYWTKTCEHYLYFLKTMGRARELAILQRFKCIYCNAIYMLFIDEFIHWACIYAPWPRLNTVKKI